MYKHILKQEVINMNQNKGFKVIEKVNSNDRIALQTSVTKKISRLISSELCSDDTAGINFKQRHGTAVYG
jgi:hypothetical protein